MKELNMSILKSITISNFMCFRKKQRIDLSNGTYLVGANNSGKSVMLLAIRCFFDEVLFNSVDFLNRTEFKNKGAGYNRSEISIEFNLQSVDIKTRKQRLIKKYGTNLIVKKMFTYREVSKTVVVEYAINGKKVKIENIEKDVSKMLDSISITYLHPQEGQYLLKNAQSKLRDRLLLNWGRRGSVTDSLENLKDAWAKLRKSANPYLSKSLTTSLNDVWPGSQTKINLPEKIDEIIAISDISFQGAVTLPEISLTAQGTGAQSLVLYLTHFLLDSDRSLHAGEYHPIWLLEEPESFLHADLIFKLGKHLNSRNWLNNIQMIISTHSPMILASSRLSQDRIQWVLLEEHSAIKNKKVEKWSEDEIKEIGSYMGDSNFEVYFTFSSTTKDLIFIEDKKDITTKAFIDIGLDITKALGGTGPIRQYLRTIIDVKPAFTQNVFFIIDADKGVKDFKRYLKGRPKTKNGLKKYSISNKIYIILLPANNAVEDLFDEYDNFLEESVSKLFMAQTNELGQKVFKPSPNPPGYLSRTHADLRGKLPPDNLMSAKDLIRNTQDIKDTFWKKVEEESLSIADKYKNTLLEFIENKNESSPIY
jgi:predicted ATPase